jgi:hypothetical protein
MTPFRLLVTAFVLAACAKRDTRQSVATQSIGHDTTELIVVDRPTVIGFFPAAKDSAEANESGYSEGLVHVQFALQDAASCLGRDRALVTLVVDTVVRIQQGKRIDTVRFPRIDSLSYGAYLVAPAAEPRLVNALGPSQLSSAVAQAIPEYFHRGPCDARSTVLSPPSNTR